MAEPQHYQTIVEEQKLLGAKEKKEDRRNLMMVAHVDMLKSPPAEIRYDLRYKRPFIPYHSQRYGSCTISSQGEAVRLWARREQFGRDVFIPESDIDKRYFRLAGDSNWESGNFNDQFDQGLYELDALKDFRVEGFTTGKRKYIIDAFMEVPRDKLSLQVGIYNFRGVKICFDIRTNMYHSAPNAVVNYDPTAASVGYHSMFGVGYDAVGLWVVHTWNRPPQLIAWEYVLHYMTEAYTCVDAKDILIKQAVDMVKLRKALKEAVEAPESAA